MRVRGRGRCALHLPLLSPVPSGETVTSWSPSTTRQMRTRALDHEHREDRRCSGLRDAEPLSDLRRRAITASETRKDRVIELPPEVLHTDMLAAPRCRGVTGR
jgi:hypothetical protein